MAFAFKSTGEPELASNHQEKAIQVWMEERARRESGVKQAQKKTNKPGKVRPRRWAEAYLKDPDGYDDLDIETRERVMPEGETEWRQAKVIRSPLHEGVKAPVHGAGMSGPVDGGGEDGPDGRAPAPEGRPPVPPSTRSPATQSQGRVVEIATGLYTVDTPDGRYVCTLRKSLRDEHSGYSNMLAVGDHVVVSHNGHKQGIVDEILPRRSALARPDPVNVYKQQVIVANVDQLLIVAAWRNPGFWPELVDRYLIAAMRHNLAPVIAVNKVDLADDRWELDGAAQAYRLAGCQVILTSAVDGRGLDELRSVLAGRTTALAGLSGVGKSSLLSAVEPGLNLKVGEVSERRQEGRHTTTQVSLHPLASGGFVVDTPGIREFGLAGLSKGDLVRFYPEFAEPSQRCEYTNCSHTREPWCGVKSAMRAGKLSRMRLESYWKILQDLA
jgi:ribosome biogenesis GTPase / thiamine phosphate phosphatase